MHILIFNLCVEVNVNMLWMLDPICQCRISECIAVTLTAILYLAQWHFSYWYSVLTIHAVVVVYVYTPLNCILTINLDRTCSLLPK